MLLNPFPKHACEANFKSPLIMLRLKCDQVKIAALRFGRRQLSVLLVPRRCRDLLQLSPYLFRVRCADVCDELPAAICAWLLHDVQAEPANDLKYRLLPAFEFLRKFKD